LSQLGVFFQHVGSQSQVLLQQGADANNYCGTVGEILCVQPPLQMRFVKLVHIRF
jgi:hypothetical protein